MFAVKARGRVDFGIHGRTGMDGELDGLAIEARKHAGEGVVDGRNARVGFFTTGVIVNFRKELGLGFELDVAFDADGDFVLISRHVRWLLNLLKLVCRWQERAWLGDILV